MPTSTTQRQKRVLIVASAPFAGLDASAAQDVALAIGQRKSLNAEIAIEVLPVDFARLPRVLEEAVDAVRPEIAIGLGVELGSPTIRLETTAQNFADFTIADNTGNHVRSTVPFPGEAPALVGSWPAQEIADSLRGLGIPAIVSHFAGTHLCNLTYYALLRLLSRRGRPVACGYIHLPLMPAQVASLIAAQTSVSDSAPPADPALPSMSFDLQLQAVSHAIDMLIAAASPADATIEAAMS